MARGFPKDELRLIDLTMRMYTDPLIEIDTDLLTSHLQAVRERKQKLLEDFGGDTALETIMSNPKFAEHLRSLGVEPPMKTSLRTGKETYAFSKTDQDFLALQEHPDERVAVAVTTRLGAKSTIEETRTEAMLGVAERGRLPIMLNYCGAHTNRFSGGDKLNLQNLPRGGAIRRSLKAPRGCVLVASDLSQIEARMLAWLAGQEDLVESFREGRDVYCEFASTIYSREITKADKSERFVGKTCLASSTQVLTDNGWKRIVEVLETDLLWDGVEWVRHGGVCFMGVKQTIKLSGVELTPDHEILVGTSQWEQAHVALKKNTVFQSALYMATLPLSDTNSTLPKTGAHGDGLQFVDVHDVDRNTPTWLVTCGQEDLQRATHALSGRHQTSDGGCTKRLWSMTYIDQGCSTDLAPLSIGATTPRTGSTNTTGSGASLYGPSGARTTLASLSMSRPCPDGMIQRGKWTGPITTKGMSRVTLGLLPEARTQGTSVKSQTWKPVFDILNSGSRNRFTILTNDGPIIVHNCVLGMGYGVGAEKFRKTLALGQGGMAINLEPNEAKRVVNLYRQTYHKIPELWNVCGYALRAMAAGEGGNISILPFTPEGIQLPNGFTLRYPALRMTESGFSYINDPRSYKNYLAGIEDKVIWNNVYGGKCVENVVQALARVVITEQMLRIARRYKIVLQVHDEVVVVTRETQKDQAIADITKIMSTPPAWAPDLPVACEAGWGYSYGDSK